MPYNWIRFTFTGYPVFIRKKTNKSGSFSIFLVTGERMPGKKHPVSRIIRNFGTANGGEALNELIQQAKSYKAKLEASAPKAKVLKIIMDSDIQSCRSFNVGFSDVYGKAFDTVFAQLGLHSGLHEKLRNLVVMRIAAPASKRRTAQLSSEYGLDCNVDSIYRLMDKLTEKTIESIKKTVYNHTVAVFNANKQTIDVLFYDLTTVSFETNTQDEIRDFGFSKDGKHQHVQVMLAVIVTQDGLPIDYQEFPGCCYEGHTLIPVLNKIQERYNINNAVLVADAALMNKINLKTLDEQGIKYIISAKIKNSTKALRKNILDLDSYQHLTSSYNDKDELHDSVQTKTIDTGEGDYIIAYHSTKRARKDAHDRQKDLEKAQKHINGSAKSQLTGKLKKPFIKVTKGCKIEIDQVKLELAQQYDGFFGLRTNLEAPDPKELLSTYHGLWQVEQTFRIAKNNLEIRPVFHYNLDRIRAHFSVCYMALALVRFVEYELKNQQTYIPYEQFHLLLDKMRKVQIRDSNKELFEFLEDPPSRLYEMYKALKIDWPKKFQHRS